MTAPSREGGTVPDDGGSPRPDGGYETGFGHRIGDGSGSARRQLAVVAETEYRLAVRSRWAVALTVVFAAFALGLTTFSGSEVSPEGFDRVVASLAVLAVYLVPLVALAFGYDAVVGREESGWLNALFALPVPRATVVLGSYLGRAVVLAASVVVGFGLAGWFLVREHGLAGFETYVGFLLAVVGLALSFLAIAVALSAVASEKTHALGGALLVWAWFVLVHDLLALGLIAAFSPSETAVTALLLSNPTGVFRALVLGSLGAAGDAGFAAVLTEAGLSTGALAVALCLWIAVPVALAALLIRRRTL